MIYVCLLRVQWLFGKHAGPNSWRVQYDDNGACRACDETLSLAERPCFARDNPCDAAVVSAGDRFEGPYINGKLTGWGKCDYANGDKYVDVPVVC